MARVLRDCGSATPLNAKAISALRVGETRETSGTLQFRSGNQLKWRSTRLEVF
jgi:hypothetical protein